MEKLFCVIEYSSFFAVRHNPTGEEAAMGDGVDAVYHDDFETPYLAGEPGMREQWEQDLNIYKE
jgi:hypothetical protein